MQNIQAKVFNTNFRAGSRAFKGRVLKKGVGTDEVLTQNVQYFGILTEIGSFAPKVLLRMGALLHKTVIV